ncbi:hypothetical protein BV22DRAFT_1074563 [Leucogyrophana mollusca]|uniref:Uncharacterized protein n=1 Tax=Leucogyrophana mollusca TaxID=85980 RepID=A0ACB8B3T6_9AGAM|nr:hypothetical protein BV22DRAFT_1074563 [Leucogyrophana mollusca]
MRFSGFKATAANLLSVPVYVWACIVTVIVGFMGDRLGHRGYLNLTLLGTGLVGYIILITSQNAALSYFACFLAASAIYPTVPNTIAWVAGNVEGAYKRSVTLAMAIGLGNINGAVSSNVYRSEDAPWYRLGHGIILAYIVVGWISSLLFMILLRIENARRDRGERDEVICGKDDQPGSESNLKAAKNGRFESIDAARREKGDEWSGIRYSL